MLNQFRWICCLVSALLVSPTAFAQGKAGASAAAPAPAATPAASSQPNGESVGTGAQPAAEPAAQVQPADVEEARRRFDRGVKLYSEGDFTLAVIEFERAYELVANYRVLYNIGHVSIQLRQHA